VAPPVITAVFPFSLVMSCILRFAASGLGLSRRTPENLNMGSLKLGGECEIAHIGGAKTIQSGD
jgi:hypothetical protein